LVFAKALTAPGAINNRDVEVKSHPFDNFVSLPLPEYCPKLRVRNLSKTFNSRNGSVEALRNVSLEVDEGEFVCVLGPSGCGKTTLLNLIAEFDTPDSGSVEISNPHKNDGPQKLVIFQEPSLFPWLTVAENVQFGLKMLGIARRERIRIAKTYLSLVGLDRFCDSYIHELSGGMKQRAALARALALDPEVLLMDEPFAALDPQTRHNLHNEILRIWAETKKTILFITHNIDEALYLADRILVFDCNPGMIKKEFDINIPKPRNPEAHSMRTLESEILRELRMGGACGDGLDS
jgi:NitT/TauT family transport system ATP-binding protein